MIVVHGSGRGGPKINMPNPLGDKHSFGVALGVELWPLLFFTFTSKSSWLFTFTSKSSRLRVKAIYDAFLLLLVKVTSRLLLRVKVDKWWKMMKICTYVLIFYTDCLYLFFTQKQKKCFTDYYFWKNNDFVYLFNDFYGFVSGFFVQGSVFRDLCSGICFRDLFAGLLSGILFRMFFSGFLFPCLFPRILGCYLDFLFWHLFPGFFSQELFETVINVFVCKNSGPGVSPLNLA